MIYLLPHIVEQSAERHPDREVFLCGSDRATYADFARGVRCVANLLREQGVRKGDRVGIYRAKGLPSALALYGIMAAGAAYVPLDPDLPANRLRLILDDCGIRDLVTDSDRAETLGEIAGRAGPSLRTLIGVGEMSAAGATCVPWSDVLDHPDHLPGVRIMEQDLAYVMYTSGSTGRPKGLMHTHHSGLSYARLAAETYGLSHRDVLANHSSLHFDMSTFDYFSGPLAGATTVIITEQLRKFPSSVARLVEDEKVTIWYSVPWALIQLLQYGALDKRDLGALRWILFGGESFPVKHLRALMQALPDAKFGNVYGPAEVNQCTVYNLPGVPGPGDREVPIGAVWDNAEALIMADRDVPAAPGEAGELLVRTPTMMQGYWGQPELTESVFYRRPGPGGSEQRYFRTGDLVYENGKGELVFAGRKDRQVKVRGFRVELDEVESALHAIHGVLESAAVSVHDGETTNRIKAGVTLKPGVRLEGTEILRLAQQELPHYAVPEDVVVVEDFPRTSSGKIDRRSFAKLL